MAKKASAKEILAQQVADLVKAGKPARLETVDFSDPNRPKTCLEVDFPILPVNQVAVIEGNAGKPIYQMSKWWARRRSSVFRAMLLAGASKAPEDPGLAAPTIWDNYYRNHQAGGSFSHLKVADIFSGGGTTLVEGSRLGLQMYGTELNPVAWFVIRNEFSQVGADEVESLLRDIEAEVKPQVMPYYACDCPRGHRGRWTDLRTGVVAHEGFRAWEVPPSERHHYRYEGPETIYVFWSKHAPCLATGCGHRTPLMSSPVIAVKTLTVKACLVRCPHCSKDFELEEADARMAPGCPQVVADEEAPYAVRDPLGNATCPHCRQSSKPFSQGKSRSKKVELSLLVHPSWLAGSSQQGGCFNDPPDATSAWLQDRASTLVLLEIRGTLPATVRCPVTGTTISTNSGTVPRSGRFTCGDCGKQQSVVEALKASGCNGPFAPFAIQGYCPECDLSQAAYSGRFFETPQDSSSLSASHQEWMERAKADLSDWWPTSSLPFGHLTHERNPVPDHGFTHWHHMFNAIQLLTHSQILRTLATSGSHGWKVREFVLGAFQQYLRNQNLFCFWDRGYDKLVPHMSNNNYHPKSNIVQNSVFSKLGRGNWASCCDGLFEGIAWAREPWELLNTEQIKRQKPDLKVSGKSEKVATGDPVRPFKELWCTSASDIEKAASESIDLVITDPPFEGLLHYSELADFFYVWLRLVLKDHYPEHFKAEYSPKTLEAVANPARHGDDAGAFYRRMLTQCWREAHRILKPAGILAFTFHHSQDEPWVNVLESLFEAGFYLEAIYPIRSDETKGEGEFGSKTVEYDMIHVCRKRLEEPTPVSWARMRKAVLADIQQLTQVLESHSKAGLPAADLQVIRRGKALEYFSRHYGKVYVDEETTMDVRRAVMGVNQLLEETGATVQNPLPSACDPFTRQFLRIFADTSEIPRDQLQKFLRGTSIHPQEFEARGWCREENKVFRLVPPLEFAQSWTRRPRQKLSGDLDQALFLVGACWEDSGMRAEATLNNTNFTPHAALGPLLEWMALRPAWPGVPGHAKTARALLRRSEQSNPKVQLGLFGEEETP